MFGLFREFARGDEDDGEEARGAVAVAGGGGEGEDVVEDGEEEGESFAGAGLGAEEGVVVGRSEKVGDCEGLYLSWFGDLKGALEVGTDCGIYPQGCEFCYFRRGRVCRY